MDKEFIVCSNCGSPLPKGGKFCGVCGHKQTPENNPVSQKTLKLKVDKVTPLKGFLGRNDELAVFPELAEKTLNNSGQALHLYGSQTTGKTAILRQVTPFLEQNGFKVFNVHGLQGYGLLSFFPFQKLLVDLLSINDNYSTDQIEKSIEQLKTYGLNEMERKYLSKLFPVELPDKNSRYLEDSVLLTGFSAAITRLLTLLSRSQPLALLIHNLQWADPFTQQFISNLESVISDSRILLVTSGRTKPEKSNPERDNVHHYEVSQLDFINIISIARAYMQCNQLPMEVEEGLQSVTEGTTLGVFFFLDYLKEKQYLIKRGDKWVINEKFRGLKFPVGIDEIIQARLELLKPHMQELLWLVAVASNECTLRLLKTLYNYPQYLRQDLDELVKKRLLVIQSRNSIKCASFSHNYLQEFVYQRIPGSGLAAFHTKVGRFMQTNQIVVEYLRGWRTAFHLTFNHEKPEKMIHYLEENGDMFTKQLHFLVAGLCYRRESQYLKELAKDRKWPASVCERKLLMVLLKMSRCYKATGDYVRMEKTLKLAYGVAVSLNAIFTAVEILCKLGEYYIQTNQFDLARHSFDDGLRIAQKDSDPYNISILKMGMGTLLQKSGKFKEAEYQFAEARLLAEQMDMEIDPSKRWLAKILHHMGQLKIEQKKYDESLTLLISSLDHSQQNHDIPLLVKTTQRLGALYGLKNEYGKALGFLKLGMKMAREIGDRLSLANVSYQSGRYYLLNKEYEEAKIAFFDTMQICREINWAQGIEMSRTALKQIKELSDEQ